MATPGNLLTKPDVPVATVDVPIATVDVPVVTVSIATVPVATAIVTVATLDAFLETGRGRPSQLGFSFSPSSSLDTEWRTPSALLGFGNRHLVTFFKPTNMLQYDNSFIPIKSQPYKRYVKHAYLKLSSTCRLKQYLSLRIYYTAHWYSSTSSSSQ